MSRPTCECFYDAALNVQKFNCPIHDPVLRLEAEVANLETKLANQKATYDSLNADYQALYRKFWDREAKLTRRDAAFAALVECVRATDQFNESINSCLSCRANLAINQTLCNFHGGRQHWVTEQRCEALKLAEGVEAAT